MNFQESLEYLYELGYELSVKKFGLENTFTLLNALGNPENNYLKIQIAGTNGKGSTCAFLESICLESKIKAGKYTSPHLVSITERICIGGAEISEEKFAEYATKIRKISENLVAENKLKTLPTFFEQLTAIALKFFADEKIEIAILETGLGGRFDSTTAAKAEIVGITPIDYDHQNILGNTLTEIASEKAAIIRPDTKVVISDQNEESLAVIIEKCRKENVEPTINGCHFVTENAEKFSFMSKENKFSLSKLGLIGEHQFQNACVAVNIAEILRKDFRFRISDSAIEKGLENAGHKGRLEWKEFKNTKFLFDGAHNASGAAALKNYLEKYRRKSRIIVIFGAMEDKNLAEISEILFPFAEKLILTEPDNPRSETPENLFKFAEKVIAESNIYTFSNIAESLKTAIELTKSYAAPDSSFILITGSLYLVGEAQKILQDESGF